MFYCFVFLLVTFLCGGNGRISGKEVQRELDLRNRRDSGHWCFDVEDDGQITWQSQDEHILTREVVEKLSNCRYLSLRGLNISDVEDGALSTLSKVWSLYLDNNKIKSLRQAMFQGAFDKKFDSLSISNNLISSIEKLAFSNLKHLEFLYLDHNPLGSDVTAETFGGLSNIKWLSISYTGVTLKPGLLQYIPQIYELRANGNPFKYVPNLWDGVTLKKLELGYCNITDLNPGMFRGLEESLKDLSLEGNHFSVVRSHSFNGLKKLFNVDLEYCGIQHIEAKAFEGAPELAIISLWHNPILTIDQDFLGKTLYERPDYYTVSLDLGPDFFHCSGGTCWLHEATFTGNALKINKIGFEWFDTMCDNINKTVMDFLENDC